MNNSEPTFEMVEFYERRTREHIARVSRCLAAMSSVTPYGIELEERARLHDASKFEVEERLPYIWLTEYHRRSAMVRRWFIQKEWRNAFRSPFITM